MLSASERNPEAETLLLELADWECWAWGGAPQEGPETSLGRSCRGPAYRWALREEASGADEEMAEQLPKAGRKVPGLASKMPGCLADVGSRPLPGLQLRRNAKERGPSPSLPRQD